MKEFHITSYLCFHISSKTYLLGHVSIIKFDVRAQSFNVRLYFSFLKKHSASNAILSLISSVCDLLYSNRQKKEAPRHYEKNKTTMSHTRHTLAERTEEDISSKLKGIADASVRSGKNIRISSLPKVCSATVT